MYVYIYMNRFPAFSSETLCSICFSVCIFFGTLAGIHSGVLCAMHSNFLSSIYFCILSNIYSDLVSAKCSGILFEFYFCESIWHIFSKRELKHRDFFWIHCWKMSYFVRCVHSHVETNLDTHCDMFLTSVPDTRILIQLAYYRKYTLALYPACTISFSFGISISFVHFPLTAAQTAGSWPPCHKCHLDCAVFTWTDFTQKQFQVAIKLIRVLEYGPNKAKRV